MHDNDELRVLAAIIAAGVVQAHGSNDESIAARAIAIAREICRQTVEAEIADQKRRQAAQAAGNLPAEHLFDENVAAVPPTPAEPLPG